MSECRSTCVLKYRPMALAASLGLENPPTRMPERFPILTSLPLPAPCRLLPLFCRALLVAGCCVPWCFPAHVFPHVSDASDLYPARFRRINGVLAFRPPTPQIPVLPRFLPYSPILPLAYTFCHLLRSIPTPCRERTPRPVARLRESL